MTPLSALATRLACDRWTLVGALAVAMLGATAGAAQEQIVYFDNDPSRAIEPPERHAGVASPYQANWASHPSVDAFAPAPPGAMPAVFAARPHAGDPIRPISHVGEQPWPGGVPPETPPEYVVGEPLQGEEPWTWQLMPADLYYRSYLAGIKEPRLGTQVQYERDLGWQFDSTLGGRVGLIRFGNSDMSNPHGWQVDFEGAAMLRQDFEHELEVIATDFRAGVPLTYANGPYRMKIAYYHLSSHLGDEYMIRTGAMRINYSRDVFVWGHSLYVTPDWRIYFEAGYAFASDDGAEPWEFQFGVEYSPACQTDFWGVPFVALNGHLREEVDFGGNVVFEIGRQWRRDPHGATTRLGFFYYNGKSPQFEFFDDYEHQIGIGLWYDM